MQNAMNPFAGVYQSQLEASRRFADAVFSGAEKIDRVVIEATHHLVAEQLSVAQSLTSVRDPRQVGSTLQSGLLGRKHEEAMNYQKELIQIFVEMQNEIGRSMQEYVEQVRTQTGSVTQPLAAASGRTTDDAKFNPVTSMFSVWESAFKEVAALAKNNMMGARTGFDQAATRAAQMSADYAEAARGAGSETVSAMGSATEAAFRAARAADQDPSGDSKGNSHGSGKRK